MTSIQLYFIAICVSAICAGQLLFKKVSFEIEASQSLLNLRVIFFGVLAISIYGGATLLWIYLLRFVALNKAYPFMALSFVVVPLASHFFFAERITTAYWVGAIFIAFGVTIAMRAS